MGDTTLTITEQGREVLTRMARTTQSVGDVFGKGSDLHIEMLESLVAVHQNLHRLGGRITGEAYSPLSLLGDSFITYGVIFRPAGKAQCPECYSSFPLGLPIAAMTKEFLGPRPDCTRCLGAGEIEPTKEDQMAGVAVPGTWSSHS